MNGKKAAIAVVVFVLVVVIAIFIAFQLFFATYEPKKNDVQTVGQAQSNVDTKRPIQFV